jgi:hypothetical protein
MPARRPEDFAAIFNFVGFCLVIRPRRTAVATTSPAATGRMTTSFGKDERRTKSLPELIASAARCPTLA